jgi:hypothetical protein
MVEVPSAINSSKDDLLDRFARISKKANEPCPSGGEWGGKKLG